MKLHAHAAKLLLAVSAIATMVSLSPASAENRRVRNACSDDIRKLCPGEKKDSPALRYCMEAKVEYLSKRCVHALEDAGEMPRGYVKGR